VTAPPAVPTGPGERAAAEDIRGRVARALAGQARDGTVPAPGPGYDALVAGLISAASRDHAEAAMNAGQSALGPAADGRVARAVAAALTGLGGLQPLLDDPGIENIDVNGCDRVFVRYADGRRAQMPPVAGSDAELADLIRAAAARSGTQERRFDAGSPRLTVQLPDGSRLFAAMAVTARPCVSVRRHRYRQVTLAGLARLGTVTPQLATFLAAAVRARKNILIAGGTGAGKTTLLRALAAEIPPHERLVTIEDTLELGLDDGTAHPNVVAMQAREANIEGAGEITQAELVRWALRMNPDRVLVGEVRGPELIAMLNVMSQGTDGSMATVHASSSAGAFGKLAAYAAQAPERLDPAATALLVASAIHFVVHLAQAPDGTRMVSSVREVTGCDGPQVASNEAWQPGPGGQAVPAAPMRPGTVADLEAAGLDPAMARAGSW
jgi:pilus assembly protein CpaF